MKKQIIILIGLKGSGKTYIGTLIQEKIGIKFLRVEDIWLSLKSEKLSNKYILEGFTLVEKEIDRILSDVDKVIIESTGATAYFNDFIDRLKIKYDLKLIKILTNPQICLKRITLRDQSNHVQLSDSIIDKINKEALKFKINFDLVIENDNAKDNDILNKIYSYLTENNN